MLKKLIKAIKTWYYNNIFRPRTDVTKKSKLGKDLVLGLCHKQRVRYLIVGVKVITQQGIAHIKELKDNNWVVISYSGGRIAEHKRDYLMQYFFEVHNPTTDVTSIYPLSFADYEYMDRDWDNNIWLEGYISNKKYFRLSDQEKETYQHLPIFNKTGAGQHILEKLKEKNINLEMKNRNLITIKNN